MIRPIITLWGLYQYDTSIFDKMLIPETLDKDTLLGYFFMYVGSNESRYGDPEEFKALIEVWSRARKPEWKRMCDALQVEYNPIENYDRTEEHEEIETNKYTETENNTRNSNGNDTTTENTNGHTENSEENNVSAFNTTTYQPKNQVSGNSNSTSETSSTVSRTLEDIDNKDINGKNDVTRTHNSRVHGNIGVTTNQQMIQSELELRMYNIYKTITMDFENEFTIPIYERRCYNALL